MNIELDEFSCKVTPVTGKHPNLLANATITFKGSISGHYFTITGLTVWKSKYGGLNVQVPQKPGFKYLHAEGNFWKKVSEEILKKYEYESIPTVGTK